MVANPQSLAECNSSLIQECKAAIEHFKKEMTRLRTGRASSALLEGIMVDYYGSATPLIQLGLINAPEPRLITVQVYDQNAVENVEKAIRQSELGLNPAREGNLIRLSIPSLTEDRRKEMIKKLGKLAEEGKVSVRNHRREMIDALKKLEKKLGLSEDDIRRGQEELQKTTDKFTAEIDTLMSNKERELSEI